MIVKELFARLGLKVDDEGFREGENAIASVTEKLVLIGAALGAAAAGFGVLVKQTAAAGAEAKETATRLGITTDEVQELSYAATMADTSIEELQQALIFLAKKGSKDVAGDLGKLADQIAGMDEANRIAFAFENFGKAGTRILPFLIEGSAGIARLREEAREMGLVLDGRAVDAADGFDDALKRLGFRLEGLRNRVIGPWLPRFEKALIRVEKVFAKVSKGLALLAKWIDLLAIAFGSTLFAAVLLSVGGFEALLVTVAAAGIELLVTAADAVIAWAAVAAPVVALAALFTLVAIILEDVYVWLTGGDSLIGELGQKWTKFLDEWFRNTNGDGWLVNAIKSVVAGIADLGEAVPQAIDFWIDAFGRFFSWVGDKFGVLVAWMAEKLEVPLGALRRLFGDAPAPAGVPATGPGGGLSSFGNGSSPGASAGASSVFKPVSPQFQASFTVNAAPGMDGQAVAGVVRADLDDWFDSKMRATAAAVGA